MIRVEHITRDGPAGPVRLALVLLDRREKKNALTPDMLENIRAAADAVHEEGAATRALVLAGEGDAFCAGFDLSLCRDDALAMGALLTKLSLAVRTLRRMPIPVVVAAHGAAIAGGCALLGGGDVVVTDANAKMGYPVVRLGVSPAVTAPFLTLGVGHARTRERLLDPALISGTEALRIGVAHECVERAEEVRERSLAIATRLGGKPRFAVASTKRWLGEIEGVDVDERLDRSLAVSMDLAGGEEERQRLAALWRKE